MSKEANIHYSYISILQFIMEIMNISFNESLINMEYLIKYQINHINKYQPLFKCIKYKKEVDIKNTINIITLKHPKFKTSKFLEKINKLKHNFKENFSKTILNQDNNYPLNSKENQQLILISDYKNCDIMNIFDLINFEKYSNKKYLKSKEINNFYSINNYNLDLKLNITLNIDEKSFEKNSKLFQEFKNEESITNSLIYSKNHFENIKLNNESENYGNVNKIVNRKVKFPNEKIKYLNKNESNLKIPNSPQYSETVSFITVRSLD